MGRQDWFRRETWTANDEKEFFDRLARSRKVSNKAQYLSIQARHLSQTGETKLIGEALKLLDLVLAEYPEPVFLAVVQHQRAKCLQALVRNDEAIDAFRAALSRQRLGRCIVPASLYLDFADFVLTLRRTELFPETLSVIEEFGDSELMPIQRYRSAVIRAFMYELHGDIQKARSFAKAALAASAETESVFRYHRDLGVVRTFDEEIQKRLWGLVASSDGNSGHAT
jgi:tetratricopeptide (TPR) repeat protein